MRVEILKPCKLFGEDVTKSVRDKETGEMEDVTSPSEILCKPGERREIPDDVAADWIAGKFARAIVRPADEDISPSVELLPDGTRAPVRETVTIGAGDVETISAEELAG